MPKNSAIGLVLGGASFVLAFSVVWYIWWLAILAAVVAAVAVIVFSSNDDKDTLLPAEDVAAIEEKRLDELARAPQSTSSEGGMVAGAPLAGTAS
jgi:cytochrome o ubiquinol oxidase subunit 1